MFKFDFIVEAESESPFSEAADDVSTKEKSTDADQIEWYESEEVLPSSETLENLDLYKLNSTKIKIGDVTLTHLVSGHLLQQISNNDLNSDDITKSEQKHSDLIPGVYEGGAKIWECTDDLLRIISKNFIDDGFWSGKRVLDLGCGSGLLGIYAYNRGAISHFQDYNKDVLRQITIPNFLLNTPDASDISLQTVNSVNKFYSGDWSKYAELTSSNDDKFDIILTSETIYNLQSQKKLINTLFIKLKPKGFVLLAAKTHYFGVGGGLRQFEELIRLDKRFKTKTIWSANEGVGREIIELRFL